MSDQNDQRMKRRVILALILAILLILALVYCNKKPVTPEPAPPEPAVPVAVQQTIPPPPRPAVVPPPEPPPPPKVEPPPPAPVPEPPPKVEPPPPAPVPEPPPKPEPTPPKIDPLIRFSFPANVRVAAISAEADDQQRRPLDVVGGTTITGQDRVICRMTVIANGQPLEYYFRLRKPARHIVWDITLDDTWRPQLAVDAGPGRKALPGLRIERQFFWTRRGIP